ncbi:hypothetical protein SEVIR_8G060300v4 [Setaria viridis]|uniref:PGG domain-containing protein n=1 Tax=Setaria viridis TaxID=4556 RepID=A0A4U6TFU9_SETVI|nr:uncharacterized protein LOC117833018 [Setaria viridis]TKV99694.1 hypothetical protein SEVIR_8G060300v2 [Setaria viridis]
MVIQSLCDIFSDPEIDLTNMTPEVKKAIANHRMKKYKMICFFGAAFVVWTDKAALLNRIYQHNHTSAQLCTFYFIIALVSVLLGIIASSFPDTAPWAMVVAWNGSLQAFLFLNACFHLRMIELYPELLHLTISFMVTSVIFSIYWSFWARDPTVRLVEAARHE